MKLSDCIIRLLCSWHNNASTIHSAVPLSIYLWCAFLNHHASSRGIQHPVKVYRTTKRSNHGFVIVGFSLINFESGGPTCSQRYSSFRVLQSSTLPNPWRRHVLTTSLTALSKGSARSLYVRRPNSFWMLLIVYGLRSLELRRLRLEDVDWEQELIRVTRFKSRCVQVYPLSDSLGEALLRYLKEARPLTQYREVFLTRRAPIQPLSSSGLVNLVARRMQRLGILPKHPGPHSLRHACATHLLTQGLSIKEIGDHLGHRDPDSTLTYAKVDLAALRRVADFNLEVLE